MYGEGRTSKMPGLFGFENFRIFFYDLLKNVVYVGPELWVRVFLLDQKVDNLQGSVIIIDVLLKTTVCDGAVHGNAYQFNSRV